VTTTSTTIAAQLSARIDRIPRLTRRHIALVVLLTAFYVFDIIDLGTFSYVSPTVQALWKMPLQVVGYLNSAAFVGMFLGGIIGGRLTDAFGRRPLLIAGIAIFSLASLASAFSTGPIFLGIARIVTGFGIQCATGALFVMVSEIFPRNFRGRAIGVIVGLGILGSPLVATVARIAIPLGGWHWVFITGSLGILVVLFTFRLVPESPRWLALHGQEQKAESVVQLFERQYTERTGKALPEPVAETGVVVERGSVRDLFTRKLIGRTLVAVGAFFTFAFINYGFGSWLPTILVQRGYTEETTLAFAQILSFAGIPGALMLILFADRFERKYIIVVFSAAMCVLYLLVGFVTATPVTLIAGFIVLMFSQTVSATIFAYIPEFFPINARGLGNGTAIGIGRLGGILSGIVVGAILTAFSVTGLFIYFGALTIVLIAIVVWGPKTKVTVNRDEETPLAANVALAVDTPVATNLERGN
jgi:MFS transporter, putative metabolite:H+ symporter